MNICLSSIINRDGHELKNERLYDDIIVFVDFFL